MSDVEVTDDQLAAVLEQLRNGSRRSTAARAVGLDPVILDVYADYDAAFGEKVKAAELEAADKVHDALFIAAESGNVAAAVKYLDQLRPDGSVGGGRVDPVDGFLAQRRSRGERHGSG